MMSNILDRLIKISLYLLAFLVPIFFLPLTIWPVALNKQMLLSFLALFCLILWLVKIFFQGKLSIVWNKTALLVLAMILVFGISMFFSGTKAQSFWGMNIEPDSFFNLILFGLVFFLFANLSSYRVTEKSYSVTNISNILYAFLAGTGILSVLFLAQVFLKKPIFPWDFAQSLGFNPVGTVQALGLFLGAGFVLLASLITAEGNAEQNAEKTLTESALNQRINQRKFSVKSIFRLIKQVLPIILGILLFTCILLINYWLIWLGIALALVIIMAEMSKSIGQAFGQADLRKFVLPLFVLVFALIAIFIRVPTDKIIQILPEINLTQQASFDIAFKTLKQSPKNLVLGSGPASFAYQYSLYHLPGINLTDFWSLRFSQGASALLSFLSNTGILGAGLVLLLIIIFFAQGLKMIYRGQTSTDRGLTSTEPTRSMEQLAVFVPGAYLFVLWFFYPFNFTLGFSAFLMLGLWVSALNQCLDQRKISALKEFSFSDSPQKAFLTMIMCAILIVGSVIGMYKVSQKYRAALVFAQGLVSENLDDAIQKLSQAGALDPKDDYFRTLSGLFLAKINEVANDQESSQEQKQELFQQLVANAEASANAAAQINPKNSQNWLQLGAVYENLAIYGVEGALDLAIANYEKTKELDPQNPQIPLNIGRVYKAELEKIKFNMADLEGQELDQAKEKHKQNFDLSMQYFEKSLELKPNFSAAYFLIAQNYEANDEIEKALENYEIVLQLEPGNEEIEKKIEELQE